MYQWNELIQGRRTKKIKVDSKITLVKLRKNDMEIKEVI